MTQLSPNTTFYDQAAAYLVDFLEAYKAGDYRSIDDISESFRGVMSEYMKNVGGPMSRYEPILHGEPPRSDKVNRLFYSLQNDINISQRQADFLRAAVNYGFNFAANEILKLRGDVARVKGKMSTLQLYNEISDSSIFVYKEAFGSLDGLDTSLVTEDLRPALSTTGGIMTLGRSGEVIELGKNGSAKLLDESNGFEGDFISIETSLAGHINPSINPLNGDRNIKFLAESREDPETDDIIDNLPVTWYEYTHFKVADKDRAQAKGFGFKFEDNTADSGYKDWSIGPPNSVLKLALEFDLGSPNAVNSIGYVPFGLDDNANPPVKIAAIKVSVDGTTWRLLDENKWIATNQSIQSLQVADSMFIGSAAWSLDDEMVRFVRVYLEQPNSINAPLGHVYYVDTANTDKRVEGPIPSISNPRSYYSDNTVSSSQMIQKREYFIGQKWSIGIRDISIRQVNYQAESHYVSKRFNFPGEIDRVSLDADTYIPTSFGDSSNWIDYFISPDDGATWYNIGRITDDYTGLPEIIAFNDTAPKDVRDLNTSYVDTKEKVTSLRVKIEMRRPSDLNASPLVRSFKLKAKIK